MGEPSHCPRPALPAPAPASSQPPSSGLVGQQAADHRPPPSPQRQRVSGNALTSANIKRLLEAAPWGSDTDSQLSLKYDGGDLCSCSSRDATHFITVFREGMWPSPPPEYVSWTISPGLEAYKLTWNSSSGYSVAKNDQKQAVDDLLKLSWTPSPKYGTTKASTKSNNPPVRWLAQGPCAARPWEDGSCTFALREDGTAYFLRVHKRKSNNQKTGGHAAGAVSCLEAASRYAEETSASTYTLEGERHSAKKKRLSADADSSRATKRKKSREELTQFMQAADSSSSSSRDFESLVEKLMQKPELATDVQRVAERVLAAAKEATSRDTSAGAGSRAAPDASKEGGRPRMRGLEGVDAAGRESYGEPSASPVAEESSLTQQILHVLQLESSIMDALQVSKAVGHVTAKDVNPTLHQLYADGRIVKLPPAQDTKKPRWALASTEDTVDPDTETCEKVLQAVRVATFRRHLSVLILQDATFQCTTEVDLVTELVKKHGGNCEVIESSEKTLKEALMMPRSKPFTVLHYCGHGKPEGLSSERGRLSQRIEGVAATVSAYLQGLSQKSPKLECVILNACDTIQQGLVMRRCGVPVVVGYQGEVEDRLATAFAKEFFNSLIVRAAVSADTIDPFTDAFNWGQAAFQREMVGKETSSAVPELIGDEQNAAMKVSCTASSTRQLTPRRPSNAASSCPFVGRKEELDKIDSWFSFDLLAPTSVAVVIVGKGGVGKSELCCKFANSIDGPSRYDHVIQVDGSPGISEETMRNELVNTKPPNDGAKKHTLEHMKKSIQDQNCLFVIDDVVDRGSLDFLGKFFCADTTCKTNWHALISTQIETAVTCLRAYDRLHVEEIHLQNLSVDDRYELVLGAKKRDKVDSAILEKLVGDEGPLQGRTICMCTCRKILEVMQLSELWQGITGSGGLAALIANADPAVSSFPEMSGYVRLFGVSFRILEKWLKEHVPGAKLAVHIARCIGIFSSARIPTQLIVEIASKLVHPSEQYSQEDIKRAARLLAASGLYPGMDTTKYFQFHSLVGEAFWLWFTHQTDWEPTMLQNIIDPAVSVLSARNRLTDGDNTARANMLQHLDCIFSKLKDLDGNIATWNVPRVKLIRLWSWLRVDVLQNADAVATELREYLKEFKGRPLHAAYLQNQLSWVLRRTKEDNLQESLQLASDVVKLHRGLATSEGRDVGELADALGSQAECLKSLNDGKLEGALEMRQEAYDLRKEEFGATHCITIGTLRHLARLKQALAKTREWSCEKQQRLMEAAHEDLELAYRQQCESADFGDTHPEALRTLSDLLASFARIGKTLDSSNKERVVQLSRSCTQLEEQLASFDDPNAQDLYRVRKILYTMSWHSGNFEQALFWAKRTGSANSKPNLAVQHDIGACLLRLRRFDEAVRVLTTVYEQRCHCKGEHSGSTLATLRELAEATYEQQNWSNAMRLFTKLKEGHMRKKWSSEIAVIDGRIQDCTARRWQSRATRGCPGVTAAICVAAIVALLSRRS